MRNKAIFASDTASKAGKGQKAWNTPPEDQSRPMAGPAGHESGTYATSGHHHRPKERATTKAPNPKYISLLPFLVSKIPDKTPKHTKEKFTFATFCPN